MGENAKDYEGNRLVRMYNFLVHFNAQADQKCGKVHIVEAERMFIHERAIHFVDKEDIVIAIFDFNQCSSVIRCDHCEEFERRKETDLKMKK